MQFGPESWEPGQMPVDEFEAGPPEQGPQAPAGAPAPEPPVQSVPPQGARKMYEPPPAPAQAPGPPASPGYSSQWAEYEPTSFIPPQDDFAPSGPSYMPGPPPGRQYAMYRQPPTWQHATVSGLGAFSAGDIFASLLSNIVVIGMGAALGYFFFATPKAAAGAGLAMVGAVQIPQVFKDGGLFRALIAAAALGGSYYLLRDDSVLLQDRAMRNEGSSWQEEEEEEDDPPESSAGARPSSDPSEPGRYSPWMTQIR